MLRAFSNLTPVGKEVKTIDFVRLQERSQSLIDRFSEELQKGRNISASNVYWLTYHASSLQNDFEEINGKNVGYFPINTKILLMRAMQHAEKNVGKMSANEILN